MQSSIGIGISLPKDLMQKIDIDRGDIPRSRYVLRILEKHTHLRQIMILVRLIVELRPSNQANPRP